MITIKSSEPTRRALQNSTNDLDDNDGDRSGSEATSFAATTTDAGVTDAGETSFGEGSDDGDDGISADALLQQMKEAGGEVVAALSAFAQSSDGTRVADILSSIANSLKDISSALADSSRLVSRQRYELGAASTGRSAVGGGASNRQYHSDNDASSSASSDTVTGGGTWTAPEMSR